MCSCITLDPDDAVIYDVHFIKKILISVELETWLWNHRDEEDCLLPMALCTPGTNMNDPILSTVWNAGWEKGPRTNLFLIASIKTAVRVLQHRYRQKCAMIPVWLKFKFCVYLLHGEQRCFLLFFSNNKHLMISIQKSPQQQVGMPQKISLVSL